jgi:hypothetical protein
MQRLPQLGFLGLVGGCALLLVLSATRPGLATSTLTTLPALFPGLLGVSAPIATRGVPPPETVGRPAAEASAPAIQAWGESMAPRLQRATHALDAFLQQYERLERTPALLNDPTWRATSAATLAPLYTAGEGLQQYSGAIPDELQAAHQVLEAGGHDLVVLAEEFGRALDTGNPRHMSNAVQRLRTAISHIERGNREWSLLHQRYGL